MGYANTVKKNVKKAFTLVGDLAVQAVFTHKSNGGFDFATNTVKQEALASSSVRGIQLTKTRNGAAKPSSAVQATFIFEADSLNSSEPYDGLLITAGPLTALGDWKIVPPINNDGYIVTVNCAREL